MNNRKIITDDGYTFYILSNGEVVDNSDPELVDLSFDSLDEFDNDPFTPEYKIID